MLESISTFFSNIEMGMLWAATLETIYMVFGSSFLAGLFGIPLGVVLVVTQKKHILANSFINRYLGWIVDIGRAVPFLILMMYMTPVTKMLVGIYMGSPRAIIPPLAAAATPFVARMVENALLEVNHGVIEAAKSAGATPFQIIWKVLLPESRSGLITAMTITIIAIIGYSTMAGIVGGGGLGSVAINKGFNLYRFDIMTATVIIMVIMVMGVQFMGDILSRRFNHR